MRYLTLILLFVAAHANANEEGPVSFDTVYDTLVGTYYCTSCHSGHSGNKYAGLDMDYSAAYENLVGVTAHQSNLKRVEPGEPDKSYLVLKLKGTAGHGSRMPMGGPYLSDEEIELVEEWIRQGAGRD